MTDKNTAEWIGRTDLITFRYKNWRGEISQRTVRVTGILWGSTEWHPHPGWLLDGADTDKHERRLFAMADMDGVQHVR